MAEVLLRLSRYGAVETLYVSGELDLASAPVLERTVAGALDGQWGEFRLDLSGVTFMDSSGSKALMRVHNQVEAFGRHLVVLSPAPVVQSVLEVLGLNRVMDVRPAPDGVRAS